MVAGVLLILTGWMSAAVGFARIVGPAMRLGDERPAPPAGSSSPTG